MYTEHFPVGFHVIAEFHFPFDAAYQMHSVLNFRSNDCEILPSFGRNALHYLRGFFQDSQFDLNARVIKDRSL